MEQVNYDTKSLRKKNGISLDLKVGYRNVWAHRLPSVTQMILNRLTNADIAKHYNCSIASFREAMKRHGIKPKDIRIQQALN